jgi:hypothetical protein
MRGGLEPGLLEWPGRTFLGIARWVGKGGSRHKLYDREPPFTHRSHADDPIRHSAHACFAQPAASGQKLPPRDTAVFMPIQIRRNP